MKKFSLFIFSILSVIIINVSAQTTKADSLENLLKSYTENDTCRVNLMNDFAGEILRLDQDKSLNYTKQAYELAKLLNYTKGQAQSLYNSALICFYKSDFEKSLDDFQKSRNAYKIIGHEKKEAVCLKYIGILYEFKGDYKLSLESYGKAVEINSKIGNKQGKANCLHNIGIVYYIQGNFSKSLEYYQKSLKINEELGSKLHIANCLNNIGSIYYERADYNSAFPYYKKSYEISKEIEYKQGEARGLNNMGEVYRLQKKRNLAVTYYQKSLKIKEEIADKNGLARTFNNIGRVYYSQEKYNLAYDLFRKALKTSKEINDKLLILDSYANLGKFYLKTQNFKKALDYTQKSSLIANQLENLSQKKRIYLQISEIYTATKNYKKALENYIQYKNLNDSIFNEKNVKELTRLESRYEFEKEKQAIKLEQERKEAIMAEKSKHQSILNKVLILVFILMTALVLITLRGFIQKRNANNILRKQKEQIEESNEKLILRKGEIQNFAFELEKANKTKDKFFSIIAHDLKNPFNALIGFTDYLLENHTILDDKERETYIKTINNSSTKTLKLLENLLTWARAQTGKIKFTTEIFNLSVLIEDTMSLIEESALNKQINIKLIKEEDLLVKADKNMIDTVIRNLVLNAIKFTNKGGNIIVQTQMIEGENNQKIAKVSVKDNGVGVSPEIQSKLFKITENITTKGTEEESGTGLGLILCKEFIEMHKGEIWVESDLGKGSTFMFTIPMLT